MSGYVYLVSTSPENNIKYFKIGLTKKDSYKPRIQQIQSNNPSKIKTLMVVIHSDPEELEYLVLNKFKQFRIRGEWFMAMKDYDEGEELKPIYVSNTLGREISEFLKRNNDGGVFYEMG